MAETIPEDSFLHGLPVLGVRDGRKVWQQGSGRKARYFTWDSLHGEVEMFSHRG